MSQPPNREGKLAEERSLDQSFSHIVWGRAGYMGNDDLNDPLVQPTGVSSSREAKRLMAKMVLACEKFISAEADKIESNDHLEWDGAETWCVAMASLRSAILWGDKRGDPVGALKAEWLRRVEQEGLDADVSTEEFIGSVNSMWRAERTMAVPWVTTIGLLRSSAIGCRPEYSRFSEVMT